MTIPDGQLLAGDPVRLTYAARVCLGAKSRKSVPTHLLQACRSEISSAITGFSRLEKIPRHLWLPRRPEERRSRRRGRRWVEGRY